MAFNYLDGAQVNRTGWHKRTVESFLKSAAVLENVTIHLDKTAKQNTC